MASCFIVYFLKLAYKTLTESVSSYSDDFVDSNRWPSAYCPFEK